MLELTDFSLSLNHLVKGKRIIEAIMEFVPDVAIEDLPIPYCAVATDMKAGRKDILQGAGSITNYEAEETAKQVYDVFNARRKQLDAQAADADDLKMLEDLERRIVEQEDKDD